MVTSLCFQTTVIDNYINCNRNSTIDILKEILNKGYLKTLHINMVNMSMD